MRGHVVAAPDKFRGSASALAVASAMADAARSCGYGAEEVPLADGGEGLLEVVGGASLRALVTGPLGAAVEATWRLVETAEAPTAIIEMALASGLVLAGGATHNDPVAATTRGTGELIREALSHRPARIVVGCGGSATTDGGLGAVEALEGCDLSATELLVATDVSTRFLDAAAVFGPQKGADAAAVALLSARLVVVADTYLRRFGVDVRAVPGAGAAGGLAGGLVALGGRIVPGFDFVAGLLGLDDALARADAVVTGEGRLDATSFAGKVVGGVVARVGARCPVLVVAGAVDRAVALPAGVEAVSLSERYGQALSFAQPEALAAEVTAEWLAQLPTSTARLPSRYGPHRR